MEENKYWNFVHIFEKQNWGYSNVGNFKYPFVGWIVKLIVVLFFFFLFFCGAKGREKRENATASIISTMSLSFTVFELDKTLNNTKSHLGHA